MSRPSVNPVERIRALANTPADPWTLDQLTKTTHEALSRWRAARQHLGIAFGFSPWSVISTIAPDFALPPDLASLVPSEDSTLGSIVLGFLTWATCPATRNIPNPFDPMLDFLHHGGSFTTEHGFIDIYASDGEKAAIQMFPYPT